MLFVELDKSVSLQHVRNVYGSYYSARPGQSTCLTPVLETLEVQQSFKKLSELLIHLFDQNPSRMVFGLNLDDQYKGIPEYGESEIQERLRKLENVKSQKYLSKDGGTL